MTQISQTQPGDVINLFTLLQKTAELSFGVNELNLRSLIDDPPKYTLESTSPALGAWSARYVLRNGSPVELALVQFKKDERTRGRDDVTYGEWTIHLKGPETPENPDGMMLVFYAVHDYVWAKWLSPQPYPMPPALNLPPAPPPPADDWLTAESQAKRRDEIERIQREMAPMPLDDGRVAAYMSGRNRKLAEVHDDELTRAGYDHDPCQGANRIPL
jgi:hypothetical protein